MICEICIQQQSGLFPTNADMTFLYSEFDGSNADQYIFLNLIRLVIMFVILIARKIKSPFLTAEKHEFMRTIHSARNVCHM